MSKYYIPTGKISPTSFIYFGLASFILLPILALLYTYLVWYIPFIYINFFITAGFGFGAGIMISYFSIKLGKVRNPKVAAILGLLGGLIALYFSWVIWVDLVFNIGESYGTDRIGITTSNVKFKELLELAFQPGFLFDTILEINKVGTWGIRTATVSGTLLFVFWFIEALIILVIATILPYFSSKKPFCEFNNEWFKEIKLPSFNFIEDTQSIISSLESNDRNSFDTIESESNSENKSHSIFTLYSSQKGESYLSIENKLASINDKGEVDFDNDEFIEYIEISTELKDKLFTIKN